MTQASIVVIYTGGTLGMLPSDQGLAPGGNFTIRLKTALAKLPPASQASLPAYQVMEYAHPIDSSAATPADWQRLARTIAEHYADPNNDAAGFVVVHGTDTLAWTASSLAYQLQGIDRAVVVTGAQQPLEAEGSDGLANIEAALRFAALPELREVAVCFAGKLMRGVRTRKWHTHAFDGFDSPNYPLLGEVIDATPLLYSPRGLNRQQRGLPRFELHDYPTQDKTPIVRIALWPGISARLLQAWLLDEATEGALLEIWGSGNIPQDPALLGVLAQATGEGKLIAAISQCPHGTLTIGDYAAGQGLVDSGVLSADAMTPEATFTKLVHLTALPIAQPDKRQRFLTALAGER